MHLCQASDTVRRRLMLVTAEIRWFWGGAPPEPFKEWFLAAPVHPFPAGGGSAERTDEYLFEPGPSELGIKARGNKPGLEIKGLIALLPDAIPDGPFKGSADLWSKWTSHS